jgi:hypothetical protein
MPSKSKAQARLMAAAAHNPAFAKKVGIPTSVAKEFNTADKGKKFGTGGGVGVTRGGQKQINKQQTRFGSVLGNEKNVPNINLNKYIGKKEGGMATEKMHSEKGEMKKDIAQDKKLIKKAFGMHDKQEHKGEHTNLSKLKKGGMTMKKMAKGGMAKETMGPKTMSKDVEKGSNKLLSHGESAVQKRGHTKGMEERNYKTLGIQSGAKGGSNKTVGAAPIKMAKGGSASSRADGCAERGKTKGKMMCMGGKA